jgi:hypothetical protein
LGPRYLKLAGVCLAVLSALAFERSGPRGEEVPPAPAPRPGTQRHVISEGPGGQTLEIAAGPGSILGKDELILKEYVDIRFGDTRLQADFVRYIPSTKEAYAEGNVILDQGSARITAESLAYNLETGTGTFLKARGYAEPSFYFEAERVRKISRDELEIFDASFTACTQPVPYWSFNFGRGLLRLNEYAYLHNLSFKVGRVTVFYTPYLIWPIKTDRASGLLFPEFGFSRRGGTVVSNAFYWAMRRNMDATFHLDYLSLAGYGTGVEYRYVPSESGKGRLTGYYLRDRRVEEEQREDIPVNRWVIDYTHNQDFLSGWRLVSNANFISDFDYFLDFERDLRLSTNPQAVSNLFLTRNRGFYSLNLRGERREQLVNVPATPLPFGAPFFASEETAIVRWTQPEIELRGRRQRLGRTPLFMTLESSADWFRKGDDGADYQRFDLFPVFSSQLSGVPWLDIDASAGYRTTYYTQSQRGDLGCDNLPGTGDFGEGNGITDGERDNADAGGQFGTFGMEDDLGCDGIASTMDSGEGNMLKDQERTLVLDESLNRRAYQAGLTIIGPKLSRIFERPGSSFSSQYKHTIEPTLRYAYRSTAADLGRAIRFDEIDAIGGSDNRVTFGLVTRLFAKRPAGGSSAVGSPGTSSWTNARYVGEGADPLREMREGLRRDQQAAGTEEGPAAGRGAGKPATSTVEIATLEVSQDYSFLGPLSSSFALNERRRIGPVRTSLRVNPSIYTSLDLRTTYDILFRQFREASLSANLRGRSSGFLDLTWSIVRDLEGKALEEQGLAFGVPFDRNQIGILGETSLLRRRLLLGAQVNYELGDILPGEPRLRDQRYKFGYNTQCCGFQVELLNRNFLGTSQREFRFLINLKGVGNVVDLHSRSGGGF